MTRILHLAGEFPPFRIGGIATYLDNLVRCQSGEDVGVVVLRGNEYRSDPGDDDTPARVQTVDIDVTRIEGTILDRRQLEALVPREHLLAEQWDILHVHDWYGAVAGLAMLGRGARALLATAHLPLREGFTYANHAVSLRWKSRLEAMAFRVADRVIAPSRYVAELLECQYDVTPAQLRVVHNGVDVERFRPAGPREPVPTLLSVSRLAEQKGLDLLLSAFALLRKRLPDVRLDIVGEGPERGALEQEASRLGVADAVRFLGYVAHHDLPAYYRRSHVFVSASIYEPFGLTTLEAMACGTPVVVSGLGGAPEIVRDGNEGFVRWPHSRESFADAIANALRECEALGERARARALELDWSRSVERVSACYREALEGTR